eukprot:3999857-Amphidinium_carterae.1
MQDAANGSLIFVWSSFADVQMENWMSESGRGVCCTTLGILRDIDAIVALVLSEIEEENGSWSQVRRWLEDPTVKPIIASLATHPRTFFENSISFMKENAPETRPLFLVS